MTYHKTSEYLGKENGVLYEDRGTFEWNEAGSHIVLMDSNGETRQYKVGENMLFHLDNEGNRVTGVLAEKYVLNKISN